MRTLNTASRQWATRPAPERYWDVPDLTGVLEKTQRYDLSKLYPVDQIQVRAESEEIYLGLPGVAPPIRLNAWSFKQICEQTGIDPSAEKRFPADMVVPRLQWGLAHSSGTAKKTVVDDDDTDDFSEFFTDAAIKPADSMSRQLNIVTGRDVDDDGVLLDTWHAKAVTPATYGYYRDLKLCHDAMQAVNAGWRTPRARAVGNDPRNRLATAADMMPCSIIREGDLIGPAGVYHGDRNTFIFLVSSLEVLPGQYRFAILQNTEVQENRALSAMFGLFNSVCSNHILWDVSNIHEVRVRHTRGQVAKFTDQFRESLDMVSRSQPIPLALYNLAKAREIAKTRDEVIDTVFRRLRGPAVSRRSIEASYQCAESNPDDSDGASPNTVWGLVQGGTRYAQTIVHADRRHEFERSIATLLNDLKEEDTSLTTSVPLVITSSGDVTTSTSAKRKQKATASSLV